MSILIYLLYKKVIYLRLIPTNDLTRVHVEKLDTPGVHYSSRFYIVMQCLGHK